MTKRYTFLFPLLIIALVASALVPPSVTYAAGDKPIAQPIVRADFARTLDEDRPLQYLEGNKFISFKPVGGLPSTKEQMTDPNRVRYGNALGLGISLEMEQLVSFFMRMIRLVIMALIQ